MATAAIEKAYLAPADIARRLNNHPSAAIRWITRGAVLSNGQRLKLRALRSPGGWLVKPEWLDEFLQSLTEDRQLAGDESASPRPRPRLSAQRRAELERVDRALASEGY
jgi:hypothetical protein